MAVRAGTATVVISAAVARSSVCRWPALTLCNWFRQAPAVCWTRGRRTAAAVRFREEPSRPSICRSWRSRKAARSFLRGGLFAERHRGAARAAGLSDDLAYGQTQPIVSTMNSLDGRIKANAAIVPAGASARSASMSPTPPMSCWTSTATSRQPAAAARWRSIR